MLKLYIRAEFEYKCPHAWEKAVGVVKWLQADWFDKDDRIEFAYSVAEEYLKSVLKVDFRIVHIIATVEGEFQ